MLSILAIGAGKISNNFLEVKFFQFTLAGTNSNIPFF